MDGLLAMCERDGIEVYYLPLTRRKGILGWYRPAELDEPPTILLDIELKCNPPLERTVLAEEIGHHKTVPIGSLAVAHSVSSDRLNRMNKKRDESRGVRWAADYLIPNNELAHFIRRGCPSIGEIAEHFIVTPWLVWRKLHFLRQDVKRHSLRTKGARDMLSPLLADVMWGERSYKHA